MRLRGVWRESAFPPCNFGIKVFLKRVYRDVHEQKKCAATKRIAAMNTAPNSTPLSVNPIAHAYISLIDCFYAR